MKKETKVKCNVKSCKHNEKKECDLDELNISCTCDNENCTDKQETICQSFEEDDDDNTNELEYEKLETNENNDKEEIIIAEEI